jgi:hypothetical protein
MAPFIRRVSVQISRNPAAHNPASRVKAVRDCLFDDSGDADCNLVLELEYVLERAVETVGPEMGAVTGVDQLLGGLCEV